MFIEKKTREAVDYLRRKGAGTATKGLLLDSGMGGFSNELNGLTVAALKDIPHFPRPLTAAPGGILMFGHLDGEYVAVQEGRAFLYEGYFHRELAFPLRVLKILGMQRIVLATAVLSLKPELVPGEMVLICDHIDLSGGSPLRGIVPEKGDSMPLQVAGVHSEALAQKALGIAESEGVSLHRGVAACIAGPSAPTPAEARMLMALGADVTAMSLAADIPMAAYLGLELVIMALIVGVAGKDSGGSVNHRWGRKEFFFMKGLLEAA